MIKLKLIIYSLFMTLISISIANFIDIMDSQLIIFNLVLSGVFLLFFHLFYYRFYDILKGVSDNKGVSLGLLYSSIAGGILSVLLMIEIYSYSGPRIYNKFLGGDERMLTIALSIILISAISLIICYIIESYLLKSQGKQKRISSGRIFGASLLYYIINLVVSFMVFLAVRLLTIFRG